MIHMTPGTDQVIFWKFWLEGVLLPFVGTFGIGGEQLDSLDSEGFDLL